MAETFSLYPGHSSKLNSLKRGEEVVTFKSFHKGIHPLDNKPISPTTTQKERDKQDVILIYTTDGLFRLIKVEVSRATHKDGKGKVKGQHHRCTILVY